MMLDWYCALAYSEWRAQQSDLSWRLLHELEWEKGARGVDGRFFVWGDGFDPSYTCMRQSHHEQMLPSVLDSFPIDQSVCGVRGLAGNMRDWTGSVWSKSWTYIVGDEGRIARHQLENMAHSGRVDRGGSWDDRASCTRVSNRYDRAPSFRSSALGFRLGRNLL